MKQIFRVVYFAGIIAQIVIRLPYAKGQKEQPKADQRISRTERNLFTGLSAAMLLLPLIHSLTSWLRFADYPASERAKKRLGWLGAGFMGASLWLFWRSHRDLGANWSPSLEIAEEHALVTNGVYRAVRHPMYASFGLWSVAQALLLPNWLAGGAGFLSFLSLYFLRVPREEQMMRDHFGPAYDEYAARTGRVLPRLRG